MAAARLALKRCVNTPLLGISKLTSHVQFEPLWRFMTVRIPQRTLCLSDTANSNGDKCLIHLTSTVMAELMPPSWVRHWPTTSMLALHFLVLSRSHTPISLQVGQPILNMLVNKYGESDGRVSHTCHSLMNASDNRDYGPTESTFRPSSSRTDGSGSFRVCMCCCAADV